jgi:hypothetical protein
MRALTALAMLIGTASMAAANDGFNVVVPGRPGVPVIINGIDASWAVIESDWGLAKNVQVQPTIYGGRYIGNEPPAVGHYYPSLGHAPAYGRLEIEPPPNRKLPKPAETYYRSWHSESMPLPAQSSPPMEPPPVIMAPPDFPAPPHNPRPPGLRKFPN